MRKTLALVVLAATLIVPRTASALENEDLLALVAMPLAVAAVSEVADVPMDEVMNVVALLNDAAVPPPQFVETIRYIPVALQQDDQANFVDFVRTTEQNGARGTQLVAAIENHLRDGIPIVDLVEARPRVDIDDDYVYASKRQPAHPHGGPPGQLKKVARVQTGAEIVHAAPRRHEVAGAREREHGNGHKRGHEKHADRGGHGKGKGKG